MAVAVGDRDRQSSRSKVSRNTAELNNAGLLLSRWGMVSNCLSMSPILGWTDWTGRSRAPPV